MGVFYILILAYFLHVSYGFNGRYTEQRCVKMTSDICADLGYNATLIPNVKAGIDNIDEAERRIKEFRLLFKVDCYVNFKFFICNMFHPVCHTINGNPTPVYPCRHVCEQARKGCEPLMKKYKFTWPDVLKCEFLSTVDDRNALCGSPPEITKKPFTDVFPTEPPAWVKILEQFPKGVNWKFLQNKNTLGVFVKIFGLKEITVEKICKHNPKGIYIRKNDKEYCPARCNASSVFTDTDKKFANVWISTWSIICFLSTFLTVSTYLIDHNRFKYPERPIIFLSFCYNLYSVGYLIRVFGNYDNIVCEDSPSGKHIVIEGMSVRMCSVVFFFLYFFGMASAIWWVILSITWFLSAALKWGHEAIEKYSSIFHAISWTIPTIQTIIAFVTRKVDGDILSGVCFVGNSNSKNLLMFVVIPLLIYLMIGTLFLTTGFVALIKIRKELQRERNTNKLERLIIRIGIFSVLYSVPATIVVGCFIHEYNRLKDSENIATDLITCLKNKGCGENLKPRTELFYLRYFMLLVVGVTSGVWIWSTKTLGSWKKFYKNNFRRSIRKNEEEREKLYNYSNTNSSFSNKQQRQKQQNSQHIYSHQRRSSNDGVNRFNGQISVVNGHGSNSNMVHPPRAFFSPPTRFFFPIQQQPAGFMQAHTLPITQVKPIDTASRGFTGTPTSNLPSDFEQNSNLNYSTPHENFQQQQMRQIYPSSIVSDHQSNNSNCSNSASLPRHTHMIDPPGSPKSLSSRSHYSTEAKL